MLRSMTGYGQAEKENKVGKASVEITAVNRKYLEILINLPHELNSLESELKELISKYVKRGKVQVYIEFQIKSDQIEFAIDLDLGKKYLEALETLNEELELGDEIKLKDILSFKEILTMGKNEIAVEKIKELIEEVLVQALKNFTESKCREGVVLQEDILKRISMIEIKIKEIESLAPLGAQRYEARLKKKISELFVELQDNQEKILREVAIMAERLDITEEITRLNSHIQQFTKAINSDETVGRLMDFLIQEMFREIGTIASKSNDIDISRLTIEVRNELDKIREQIQNIE